MNKIKFLGTHVLLELYDCPGHLLSTPSDSERILLAAAEQMQATVIEHRFHAFAPHGVSGVVVIAESHLTIHTWPEYGYAAIDVFSCGDLELEAGIALLIKEFKAVRSERKIVLRGKV